jgi:hypothetical protein
MQITINWSTADELIAADPPVVSRIDAPTPNEVVEELRAKIPGFRRAFDEDGLGVQEFANFGPLMLFKTMFERVLRLMRWLTAARVWGLMRRKARCRCPCQRIDRSVPVPVADGQAVHSRRPKKKPLISTGG